MLSLKYIDILDDPGYRQDTLVRMSSETHSGENVGVFATGPWSHLFTGTVEQHYLADAIMYASCTNPALEGEHCSPSASPTTANCSVIRTSNVALLMTMITLVVKRWF